MHEGSVNRYEIPREESQTYVIIASHLRHTDTDTMVELKQWNYCVIEVEDNPIEHLLTLSDDDGGSGKVIRVGEGDRVWFRWDNCPLPQSVFQVDMATNPKHTRLFQRKINSQFTAHLERSPKFSDFLNYIKKNCHPYERLSQWLSMCEF